MVTQKMTKVIPNIPIVYEDLFPKDYKNTLPYWGFFSREELEKNKGNLLLLDIDLGRFCSLNCPDCFRQDNEVDNAGANQDLSFGELIKTIEDGKKLGLKYVKICGVGEPTESSKLIPFVDTMTNMGIGTAIFTKGQGLGNDDIAKKFHKRYGINKSIQLAERLYPLNTSLMLGFHSFNPEIQDRVVRTPNYTAIRNAALENLANVGFTNSNPSRLAFCNAPVRSSTAEDAFPIYTWARERNIHPVTAVLMNSGKQIDSKFLKENDLTEKQKLKLWTDIYSWNIERGIQTLDQIEKEGISCLPGGHPCNQLCAGLYVTMKGNVVGCPGYTEIQGNIRDQNLAEIWETSKTRKLANGRFNHGCPPKEGITIPKDLYQNVLSNLREKYSKK